LFDFDAHFNASKPIREVVIFSFMMAATKPLARTSIQLDGDTFVRAGALGVA
jgi:hypothetical protein